MPVHDLRARPTRRPGDAVAGPAARGRHEFRSDEDGFITALRFYKQANNTGTHVGHLWSGSGQLLASATFTSETASGWQEVALPEPGPVTKDTTYVASYYSRGLLRVRARGYFAPASDRAPLNAPSATASGGNGVFKYGASGFPDQTLQRDQLLGRRDVRPDDPAGHARPGRHRPHARRRRDRRRREHRRHGAVRRAARAGVA